MAATLALTGSSLAPAALAGIGPGREAELERLLAHDCGACHGLTRKGGLGSPLTPEALAARPEAYLFAAIREGVPGTPMPPWSALLDDEEIRWLLARLLSGDPP